MGGHWILPTGVIPDGPLRRFYEMSLFPLPLGQP